MAEYSQDGYVLDSLGREYGYCNSCGDEQERDGQCCDDGEVVPYFGQADEDGPSGAAGGRTASSGHSETSGALRGRESAGKESS